MLGIAGIPPRWRTRFEEAYHLAEAETLRRVAPPFIPERALYYQSVHASQAMHIPKPPEQFVLQWNGRLGSSSYAWVEPSLRSVLAGVLRLKSFEYEAPPELLAIEVPGD